MKMKQLLIGFALLLTAQLFLGCVSAQKGEDIRKVTTGITADMAYGMLLYKPESRVAMETMVKYLDAAESTGSVDIGTISTVMENLPFLKSRDSRIGIFGARVLLRRLTGDINVDTPEGIRSVAMGIRDGLRAELTK
jgi:hypothetical protein